MRDNTARPTQMTFLVTKKSLHSRRGCTLLSLLVTFFLSSTVGAVDFKGIELGEPLWLTEERSVFGTLDCNPMQLDPAEYQSYVQEMQQIIPGARTVCTGNTSIAAVPAYATVVLGTSRRVLRLTFQFAGEDYSHVLSAMTSKWGQGVVEDLEEHGESVWWDFADGSSISVHQMPGNESANAADEPLLIGLVEYSLPVTTPERDL